MAQKRISEEFLEGILEVYSTLMTNQLFLKLLDEESTVTNIYGEAQDKVYLAPIQLTGKIAPSVSEGSEVVEGTQEYVTVTIPTKSLLDKGIDITPQNYKTLEKGVIHYKGVDYLIKTVKPQTNIDDVFQFYIFDCEKPKTRR